MGWVVASIALTLIALGLIAIGVLGRNEAARMFAALASHLPSSMWSESDEYIKQQEMDKAARLFENIGMIALVLTIPLWVMVLNS